MYVKCLYLVMREVTQELAKKIVAGILLDLVLRIRDICYENNIT